MRPQRDADDLREPLYAKEHVTIIEPTTKNMQLSDDSRNPGWRLAPKGVIKDRVGPDPKPSGSGELTAHQTYRVYYREKVYRLSTEFRQHTKVENGKVSVELIPIN